MQVEIRSNILGDIAKIRKGVVFKEPATVVDELLQNCQRAKATQVKITAIDDVLEIIDNGVGCKDAQAIFEKNTTAWGDEDEAFGEGFFSVFLLADSLYVASCDWELKLDILEMMSTGNLHVNVTESETYLDGFHVKLIGKTVKDNQYALRNEIRRIGKITDMPIVLNNDEIEKEPLFSLGANDYAMYFDNDIYEAVLEPRDDYGFVDVYYEKRHVKDHFASGIRGNLEIKKGKVTLKAPDRKEFIWDNKIDAFNSQLAKDTRTVLMNVIAKGDNAVINAYAQAISTFVDVEDYIEYLLVDSSLFEIERQVKDDVAMEHAKEHVPEFAEIVRDMVSLREFDALDTKIDKNTSIRIGTRLVDTIARDHKLVWVGTDVEDYDEAIAEAEYFGFRVIIARNKLYEKAFDYLGVPHVGSLKEKLVEDFVAKNTTAKTKKEERLLSLMNKIEQHLHIADGTIQFADLSLELRFDGTATVVESIAIEGCCSNKDNKIYLSRSLIDWITYRAQDPSYPNVTAHDYKVLFIVLPVVAHELAHYCFGTKDNTKEHNAKQEFMYKEIIKLF